MTSHIEPYLWQAFAALHAAAFGPGHHPDDALEHHDAGDRQLSGGGGDSAQATHITFHDLYASIMFFAAIYVGGQIAARLLKMPSLVGEIFAGILLGPNLAGYVPFPISFVMLGEIGLILLVIEAGIDIDLTTLKLIGSRGLIIAIVGSVLPIAAAFVLALGIGTDLKGALAAGACFGPTSLGIAMNILRQGKIVNTPVGQLIISAAVIDDMIALIILSQLGALAGGGGEATAADVAVPIASALGFLVGGGALAILVLPKFLDAHFFPRFAKDHQGSAGLGLLFLLLFALMPATYYAKSSFLMGAFLSGLTFCRNHDVHVRFVSQFKRLLQWLMRVFFAASIGFQVPLKDFADGTVIAYGALFTLALTGKLAVGFLVPNFNNSEKFKGLHMRDCLITGCSMAAEGEFAFVIAVFAKDNHLINAELYASIVLAVLVSTIVPPFALRFTISYYNKVLARTVKAAEKTEKRRSQSMDALDAEMGLTTEEEETVLRDNIEANKIIFVCIQIQCASAWGLVPKMMTALSALRLEVIDNRSWHPRGVDSTLMTEMFAQDDYFLRCGDEAEHHQTIDERLAEVSERMTKAIKQRAMKIKVTRWFPGVLQEIAEEVRTNSVVSSDLVDGLGESVRDRIQKKASRQLENKQKVQLAATELKPLEKIMKEMGIPTDAQTTSDKARAGKARATINASGEVQEKTGGTVTRRRVRQKMRSTPVTGGSLFDDHRPLDAAPEPELHKVPGKASVSRPSARESEGRAVELVVDGQVYRIRVLPGTLQRIEAGYSNELLEDSSVQVKQADVPLEHRLQGFIRTGGGAEIISEEVTDVVVAEKNDKEMW